MGRRLYILSLLHRLTSYLHSHGGLGNQVLIEITDNGIGMNDEVQRRLFDSFFTTKPVGTGTGLGMSISYQVIERHGGQLKCVSAPGQGTEFYIQIPIQ